MPSDVPTPPAAARDRPPLGPVPPSQRALAPDLARGTVLLLIALANGAGAFFLAAPGLESAPQGAERLYNVAMVAFVHARAYPMFAFLLGYGMVQLARRQEAAASPGAGRAVLLRRSAWLLAFGALHGILLFSGDILGAYGIVGIAVALLLLGRGDRFHRLALWLWAASIVSVAVLAARAAWLVATASGTPASMPIREMDVGWPSMEAPTYAASVLARLTEWPTQTLYLLGVVFVVWLGVWAARHRVLEEPARHRRLLAWTAGVGLTAGVAGGLPMGLFSAGWLHADAPAAGALKALYEASGQLGGIGYVALFGLIALALENRRPAARRPKAVGAVVDALTALGQRSLSGYLIQSVAWLVLVPPFALGLGTASGSTAFTATACAAGVWLATVVAADQLRRRSLPGPAEVLLRRLVYGRRN
ncbi:DUF418 domain-containing protein [Streptomonospora sp. S1-112]|uniref:DUF418 domain-containing protein n=1 Tax=Streptomonospora mangrovi TaxID=2883123 RepID=A0A9X3SGQ3_9ACTN|nr:DUF418 domain-containing protein [Streptomonospora mangrovi]MDA0566175.1 DUF418 domain-containing protein [Streptomonospora mangrovi]